MMLNHRQNIETAWDNLLESISDAALEARADTPLQSELAARLDTLHAALRGLGNAWASVRDQFPSEPADAPDQSDVPGALPESAYWRPLAECLLALGGAALAPNAIAAVGVNLKTKLKPVDREPLPTGTVRWVNRTQFARQRLKEYGLIRKNSRHGLWELTKAGNRWVADLSKPPVPSIPTPEDNLAQPELPF
jgi:hypothetical protein